MSYCVYDFPIFSDSKMSLFLEICSENDTFEAPLSHCNKMTYGAHRDSRKIVFIFFDIWPLEKEGIFLHLVLGKFFTPLFYLISIKPFS